MSRRRTLLLPLMVRRFMRNEAAAGLVLMAAAAVAMIVANSPLAHGYHDAFHDTLPWTPVPKLDTLHLWINDGLMVIFFFVVGLEIKREIVQGELSNAEKRRLPVIAAAAGMAAPAAVYLLIAGDEPGLHSGWAIPAATDIAFAMGVLALLGNRVPPQLRLFLLSVAIVDDIGAVLVIALFYTASIMTVWLLAAIVVLGALIGLNRFGVRNIWPYIALAVALWVAVLHSGVHATIAGVVAALTVPIALDRHGDSPLLRLEHNLVSWNAFMIVPVFGFANAGVSLAGVGPGGFAAPLPLAIAAGLVIGKQLGIFGSVWLSCRLGMARSMAGASWPQIWGISMLCGIGFTMSLFIGALAFPARLDLVEQAKLGVLAGSLISALAGYFVLKLAASRERPVTA